MTCEQTQSLLNAYLDNELTPSERARVQTHLQSCANCQNELAQLSTLQTRVRTTLQHRAAAVQPPAHAWQTLAPKIKSSTPLPHPVHGGTLVRKPLFIGAVVAVLVLTLIGVWITRNATPVSAQEILNRSAHSQQNTQPQQGIQHTQTKIYFNPHAVPPPKQVPGEPRTTLMDSYRDPRTGYYRSVARNTDTNQITDVNGFDGLNLYTANHEDGVDVVTTVYRTPQVGGVPEMIKKQQMVRSGNGIKDGAALNMTDQELFERMRATSANTSATEEQWENGRKVYVLHMTVTEDDVNKASGEKLELRMSSDLYFDAETYAVLGQANYNDRDGQSTLFYSSRIILQETLPADTIVAWDMTDLTDVQIVDDAQGQFGDQLPGPITADELAKRTTHAYLLSAVPAGFTLTLTAPPNPRPKEPDIYIADYRDADDNYFVIQGGMGGPTEVKNQNDLYTTQSGLKVYFDGRPTYEMPYLNATVVAPDGTQFLIAGKLPLERMQELAEQLVQVK